MKMNEEIKNKIQEHINEACRDYIWGLKEWLYDGFVENNEMSKFSTRNDLEEAYKEYALRNVSFASNAIDNDFTEPILDPVFEWAKEEFGEDELACDSSWDFNWNAYHFPIDDIGEWEELIDEVRQRVVAKWVESHAPLTAREIAKEFKNIGEDEFYGDIWIAKKVDEDYTMMKDIGDLFEASLFGYGIRFVESDEDGDMVIWLCKMKETNITTKVLETMAKSVFKEAA